MLHSLSHAGYGLLFLMINIVFIGLSYEKQERYKQLYSTSPRQFYKKYIPKYPLLIYTLTAVIGFIGASFLDGKTDLISSLLGNLVIFFLISQNLDSNLPNKVLDYSVLAIYSILLVIAIIF